MKALPLLIASGLVAVAALPCGAADVVLVEFERNAQRKQPVVIELFEQDAPRHVANFKRLVGKGFYQGIAVHRVVSGSLVQLGDPLSRKQKGADLGTGGPGYTLAPEIFRKHESGVVGMARLGDALNPARVSNGSQFYIALRALPELDGKQTVFGRVREGLDVLKEVGESATDTNDAPLQRVVVRRARVVREEEAAARIEEWKRDAAGGKGRWGWLGRVLGFGRGQTKPDKNVP
ncbi:MAG: hypothetical protein RLZZ142_858 [Verrucomicrobiota bacterium]|jgi:peptidyl-prolyl cis-trans isomerase B (cyclophilin B)